MTSWKRTATKALGDALNVHIVRKGRAGPLLEEDLLTRFLHDFEVDCVFDVGANAGQYARMLRRLGYRGAIVSFEPIPVRVKELKAASSSDSNWFVEPLALDETESDLSFNVMASDQFSSLKNPHHGETARFSKMNAVVEQITLRTARLETLYDRYRETLQFQRPFLKMDTQGNDLAVARGAGSRLCNFVGLQSELAIKRIYDQQSDYRQALDFYEKSGFALSGLVPNNAGHFPELIEVDCVMYNLRLLGQDARVN